MPKLVGFSRFAALPEEQISEKISRRILSGDQGMIVGVHVEPVHSIIVLARERNVSAIVMPSAFAVFRLIH